MQRINLGTPYEEFIRSQIEAGFFGSATEVIRDALRDKMAQAENDRISQIKALLDEAEVNFRQGEFSELTSATEDEIKQDALKKLKEGHSPGKHVIP